jgi:hypothetical protein
MKRCILLVAALTLPLLGAMAQSTPAVKAFTLPSARMAALGGPHAASVRGVDSIFENPAGFAAERTEYYVSALVFNPSGPIFDIAGMLLGGGDMTSGLASLFDAGGRLYVEADLLGPLAFGYAGRGLGFGLFNTTTATVNAASLLSVSYSVSEDILLAGGYAYRFDLGPRQSLDVGIMPKGFLRASAGKRATLTDIMALVQDPASVLDSPLSMTSGVGFDVGLRWEYAGAIALGLVARDAYSPAMVTSYEDYAAFTDSPSSGVSTYAVVPADLSFGLAYDAPFPLLDRLGADLLFLVDYSDILDLFKPLPRNPILNVRLGVELTLLDILSLRVGVKDALPTAGFGVDLSAFTFSLAMYGQELGIEPGARPLYNLLVALDFRYR